MSSTTTNDSTNELVVVGGKLKKFNSKIKNNSCSNKIIVNIKLKFIL